MSVITRFSTSQGKIHALENLPVNACACQIRTWTSKDSVLSRVKKLILQGWVDASNEQLQPHWSDVRMN